MWVQRGGRGMSGRGAPAGRSGLPGRSLPGRGGLRPGQNPADHQRGSGPQINRPLGRPVPPSQAPWMAGRGAASSKPCKLPLSLSPDYVAQAVILHRSSQGRRKTVTHINVCISPPCLLDPTCLAAERLRCPAFLDRCLLVDDFSDFVKAQHF